MCRSGLRWSIVRGKIQARVEGVPEVTREAVGRGAATARRGLRCLGELDMKPEACHTDMGGRGTGTVQVERVYAPGPVRARMAGL